MLSQALAPDGIPRSPKDEITPRRPFLPLLLSLSPAAAPTQPQQVVFDLRMVQAKPAEPRARRLTGLKKPLPLGDRKGFWNLPLAHARGSAIIGFRLPEPRPPCLRLAVGSALGRRLAQLVEEVAHLSELLVAMFH